MKPGTRLRLRKGRTKLERRAIDEHARRLELRFDPKTRLVSDPGRAKGGLAGLRAAASACGDLRALGLDALCRVEERPTMGSVLVSLGLRRARDEAEPIQVAIRKLNRATQGMEALAHRWRFDIAEDAQILAVANEIAATPEAMKAALDALGRAGPIDLARLEAGLTACLQAVDANATIFDDICDERNDEIARRLQAALHRAQPMRRMDGLFAQRDTSVVPRQRGIIMMPMRPA